MYANTKHFIIVLCLAFSVVASVLTSLTACAQNHKDVFEPTHLAADDATASATVSNTNDKKAMDPATLKAKALAKKQFPKAKKFACAVGCYNKNGLWTATVSLTPVKEH